MKIIKNILGLLFCISALASLTVGAKEVSIFDFHQAPFENQLSKHKVQKMLREGAIKAKLAIPTYVSLIVDGNLMSGIAPADSEVIMVPNDDDDYYTIIPIVGGSNVSQQQQTDDFESSPHIQLIWYLRNDQYDAVYTLVSLGKR